MTDKTPLDYTDITTANHHEPSTATCWLCGLPLSTPHDACPAGCAITDKDYKPVPDAEREQFADWFEMTMRRSVDFTSPSTKLMLEAWQARARLSPAIPVDAIEYALASMEVERQYLLGQFVGRQDSMAETWKSRLNICVESQEALRKLLESAK